MIAHRVSVLQQPSAYHRTSISTLAARDRIAVVVVDGGTANLPTSGGYFFGEQAKLEVVRFGHAKHPRALVVAIPTADEEDPANVYQVFVADGPRLRKIYEATIGSYGVVPLEFAGDGTVSYLEDGWAACERTKFPTQVKRNRIVLALDATYYCPDVPGVPSACRKPSPGLVLAAAAVHHIDLAASYFVGDKVVDVECGRRAGTRTVLVLTGYGATQEVAADLVCRDAVEASGLILAEARSTLEL
ncbi:MAG: HAD hydrolase-like protein [Candidatus Solibacter sp.]